MPLTYRFEDGGRGVVVEAQGEVKGQDVLAINVEIYQEPHLSKLRYQLWDFTGGSTVDASTTQIREIVEQDDQATRITQEMFVAVVGPQDIFFGLARMWEILAESTGIVSRIFRDRAEADQWLMKVLGGGAPSRDE